MFGCKLQAQVYITIIDAPTSILPRHEKTDGREEGVDRLLDLLLSLAMKVKMPNKMSVSITDD